MSDYFHERIAEIRAEMEAARPRFVPAPCTPLKKTIPTGHVYFLKAGNAVKIGFSTNVRGRLKSIQTGCPDTAVIVKVVAGDMKTEKSFHKRFAEYRQNGEWFDLRGKLARYLERCVFAIDLPEPTPQPETEFYF